MFTKDELNAAIDLLVDVVNEMDDDDVCCEDCHKIFHPDDFPVCYCSKEPPKSGGEY